MKKESYMIALFVRQKGLQNMRKVQYLVYTFIIAGSMFAGTPVFSLDTNNYQSNNTDLINTVFDGRDGVPGGRTGSGTGSTKSPRRLTDTDPLILESKPGVPGRRIGGGSR